MAGEVYAVRQINPDTGRFDEWKIMMGYSSLEDAAAYQRTTTRPAGKVWIRSMEYRWQSLPTLLAQGVFATRRQSRCCAGDGFIKRQETTVEAPGAGQIGKTG